MEPAGFDIKTVGMVGFFAGVALLLVTVGILSHKAIRQQKKKKEEAALAAAAATAAPQKRHKNIEVGVV